MALIFCVLMSRKRYHCKPQIQNNDDTVLNQLILSKHQKKY
jgi:hypothetical protein